MIASAATGLDGCTRERFPEHTSFDASAIVTAALQKAIEDSRAQSRSGEIVSIDALMLEDDRMIEDFVEQDFQAVDLEPLASIRLAHISACRWPVSTSYLTIQPGS